MSKDRSVLRSNRWAPVLIAPALLLAACSGNAAPATKVSPSSSPRDVQAGPAKCPLTGRRPGKGVEVQRPAVAVKIENSPEARPQSGLDHADVVFEELVEGGITRFAAIFQCDSVKKAGPVRSARFDDPDFIKPVTSALAFAGANAIVTRSLTHHHMKLFTDLVDPKALYRVPPGNTSDHSLFANVALLIKQARAKHVHAPPNDLYRFGPPPTKIKPAKKVDLKFEDSSVAEPIGWRWKKGLWKRYESGQPFMAADGHQISTPNLLIQRVNVKLSTTLVDVAGNPSPRITFSGHGNALLFRHGGVIKGRWKRRHGHFLYTTRSGKPLIFAPGPIWIELLPSDKGSVKGTISF
jgi:Protein of unknown function (DUF3048) N-terminal domain/Protein of unknown function (DUF3048) C-terminal domain